MGDPSFNLDDQMFENGIDIASEKTDSVGSVSSQSVITSEIFYLLLLIGTMATFYTTQAFGIKEWYRRYFSAWIIRGWGIWIACFVTDVLMAAAFIYYAETNRHVSSHGSNADWFVSLMALWFVIQALKYLWSTAFWFYFYSTAALGVALFLSVLITITTIILAILYFVRSVWPSAACLVVVAILYIFATVFNGVVFYRQYKAPPRPMGTRPPQAQLLPPPQNATQTQYPYPGLSAPFHPHGAVAPRSPMVY